MTATLTEFLADEAATVAAGKRLGLAVAPHLSTGITVFLDGVLGAGKTTFCRGVLQAFGHCGPVKSPTYTLVEPYEMPPATVYHFDLYRLGAPDELEFMGIRDYFQAGSLCIVEWPSRGEGILPEADLLVKLAPEKGGRRLTIAAATPLGKHCLEPVNGLR